MHVPISPREVEDHVKSQYQLTELFNEIDSHLKQNGIVASSVCWMRDMPDIIADQVSDAYRNVGWNVNYRIVGDRTCFVFTR